MRHHSCVDIGAIIDIDEVEIRLGVERIEGDRWVIVGACQHPLAVLAISMTTRVVYLA